MYRWKCLECCESLLCAVKVKSKCEVRAPHIEIAVARPNPAYRVALPLCLPIESGIV
jgi:hypothetical protein